MDDILVDFILSLKDYEELVSEAYSVNVHWSTRLEGNKLSLEEVRESYKAIMASKVRHVRPDSDSTIPSVP